MLPTALRVCVLMLGALAMHYRMHDLLRKPALPAAMRALATIVVMGSAFR
ncbi:MAG: hypothetical protein ABIY52_15060 [Gemmatimonadaceae bacterium]